MMQLGVSYKRVRKFREKVTEAWPIVAPFLRGMVVKLTEKGIELHPSKQATIPPRQLPPGQAQKSTTA
jgi:hypothetical protein